MKVIKLYHWGRCCQAPSVRHSQILPQGVLSNKARNTFKINMEETENWLWNCSSGSTNPNCAETVSAEDRKLTYSLSDDNGCNQVPDRFILSSSECLLGRYAQFWACKLSTHWLHWAKYGFVLTQTVGRSKLSTDVSGERRSLQATGQMSAPTPILCLPYEHTLNQSVVIGCRIPSVKIVSECDAIQKKDPKDPWQC